MENSWLASVFTGGLDPSLVMKGGVGSTLLYAIWQILKANRRGDKLDAASDKLFEKANRAREDLEKRVTELEAERSKAAAAEARLTAENGYANERITDLRTRLDASSTSLSESEKARRELAYENSSLRAKVEVYDLRLRQLLPSPPAPAV